MVPSILHWYKVAVGCPWQRNMKLLHPWDSPPTQELGFPMGRLWGRTGNLIAFYILNWVGSSGFLPLEKRQKCWESPTPEAQIYRVRLSLKLEQEHWKTSCPTTGLTPRNKQSYLLLEKWWEYGETFPPHPRTDPVVLILRAYCKLRVGHKHNNSLILQLKWAFLE